ncbi:hypothetical protein Sez_1622 [Streptococcus equi subsp. zooepidemicus MGCS10565]|uniref:Uncharacterized protein n=1 Tax=Streptococcus equi subsp. zooepidemicus (strain MGCS10565) TaxID=552526 RepID=B4U4N6_STREM|nr:hypothetical protein Sez_1622 [Streptococcus equi subsp. zooepidemicus MGCS10565]
MQLCQGTATPTTCPDKPQTSSAKNIKQTSLSLLILKASPNLY